jgi:D-alanine-D-alanine ligase
MQRIGIIRGGMSDEYDISIKTGGRIIQALQRGGLEPIDMLVTRDGVFHVNGKETDIERIPEFVDGVFIALHGKLGEDGRVQKALETLGVPYNGTHSSNIGRTHDKRISKQIAAELGIAVPDAYVIPDAGGVPEAMREAFAEKGAREIWEHVAPPWVVKPTNGGSSKMVRYAATFPELTKAVYELLGSTDDILAETHISGREVHMFAAENFRNQPLYVAPPLEIFHGEKIFSEERRAKGDYTSAFAKHADSTLNQGLEKLARDVFEKFGLAGYATMNFLVTPKKIYLLEVDALPAFDEHSPLTRILDGIGAPLEHVIVSILNKKTLLPE